MIPTACSVGFLYDQGMGGKWQHRLEQVNEQLKLGDCAACGPHVPLFYRADRGRWICREARRDQAHRQPRKVVKPWRKFKAGACARCGLIPEDPCVLEVDHIAGRKVADPHAPENLQTLCANCHKIKTYRPDLF